jgi:hypothetical protein
MPRQRRGLVIRLGDKLVRGPRDAAGGPRWPGGGHSALAGPGALRGRPRTRCTLPDGDTAAPPRRASGVYLALRPARDRRKRVVGAASRFASGAGKVA